MAMAKLTIDMECAEPIKAPSQTNDDDVSTNCGGSSTESSPMSCKSAAKLSAIADCGGTAKMSVDIELSIRFFALLQSFEDCPHALCDRKLATDRTYKNGVVLLVRRCFRLLAVAGFSHESIEVVAAQAAVYITLLSASLKNEDSPELPLKECSYTLCLMMFLAHSYVEDRALPLVRWHTHLFVHYCPMGVLNSAMLGLLQKLDFKLRVESEELERHIKALR